MKRIALAASLLLAACGGPDPDPDTDAGPGDGGPAQDADVERVAPRVIATVPGNGASEVDPTTSIRIVFSEPVVAGSGTIELEADGAAVALDAPSASADGRELTVQPSAPLAGNTTYQATIAGFRDLAGNAMASAHVVSFSTSDPFAPTVVGATPAEGATDVSTGLSSIEIQFSEPMNAALGVAELSGGPGTIGAPTWNGARATFPVSGLAPNTAYRVALVGFADPAGNALDGSAYLGDGALDFTGFVDAEGT
ncbi:MAG TPA: Ig-like domain-containing protein, partial [Sandaracinaceae bacterium]